MVGVQSHFMVKPNLVLRLGWGFDKSLFSEKFSASIGTNQFLRIVLCFWGTQIYHLFKNSRNKSAFSGALVNIQPKGRNKFLGAKAPRWLTHVTVRPSVLHNKFFWNCMSCAFFTTAAPEKTTQKMKLISKMKMTQKMRTAHKDNPKNEDVLKIEDEDVFFCWSYP